MEAVDKSIILYEWLEKQVCGLRLNNDLRTVAGAVCFGVGQDHFRAIICLLGVSPPNHTSASALCRPLYESYVRGTWLLHCASEKQLQAYLQGRRIPDMASLISAIDKVAEREEESNLRKFYVAHWDTLCGLTHSGAEHFVKWDGDGALGPKYSAHDTVRLLDFAARFGVLCVAGVASQSDQPELSSSIMKECQPLMPPRGKQSAAAEEPAPTPA